jgi:hypothetical protein
MVQLHEAQQREHLPFEFAHQRPFPLLAIDQRHFQKRAYGRLELHMNHQVLKVLALMVVESGVEQVLVLARPAHFVQAQQGQGRLVVSVLLVQLARELRPAQLNSSRLLQDALQQELLNQQRHQ